MFEGFPSGRVLEVHGSRSAFSVLFFVFFSRARNEGFLFNSGGLGMDFFAIRCCSDRSRPQPLVTVRRWSAMVLTFGEAFGEGFEWKHDVSDSCDIARKQLET